MLLMGNVRAREKHSFLPLGGVLLIIYGCDSLVSILSFPLKGELLGHAHLL